MVSKKDFQVALFKLAARFQFLNWLFFPVIVFGIVIWTTEFPLNLKTNPWFYIPMASIWLLSFFAWILVWGWYSIWFRYLAYGVSHVISVIRRLLSSTLIQIIIILGLSAKFWIWRKSLYFPKKVSVVSIEINFWEEVLKLDSFLKILVIAAAVFMVWKLFQSRKRIVICDFVNFTDKDELDSIIKGLASICSNEMGRLSKLLKTYDDIHPDAKKNMGKIELNLDVQDIGKDFEEIIGPDSSIKIGNIITVPIRALYSFFRKILHGPMLTGGVHLKGDKFILTSSLKGGKFKGSWNISFEEDETPPNSDSEQLNKLTQRLVCRILTDLSPQITPRWRAMQHFTEGLRLFRETLLTQEKRTWRYIKAKDAFSLAVRDDEKFVQCYYNFGYIYRKLENNEAAKAAFRKALEEKPNYHQCYYQLAIIYYVVYLNERRKDAERDKGLIEYNLLDAQWFCQQAITICPTDPSYWDLLAIIQYYSWKEKVEKEVISSSMIGTMLAWQELCKSIIKKEKNSKYKDTPLICSRNLAILIGLKKKKRAKYFFRQAIFLAPDNNDLHFERGKSFYRQCKTDENSGIQESNNPPSQTDNKNKVEIDKKNAKKAYNAFKRVFEDDVDVDDPFSFWAFYMNVNAQLWDQEKNEKKKKKYKDVVDNGYVHFLDAAAEIIHKDKSCQYGMIQRNEGLVSEALELTGENNKAHHKGFLLIFIKFIKKERVIKKIVQGRVEGNTRISKYRSLDQTNFFTWMKFQIDIKSAIFILQTKKNDLYDMAKITLESAINNLRDKYPNELKILGLHMHLAMAYLLSGSYEEALKHAREAARLSPYEPDVRETLGNIYLKLRDYRQAIRELQNCFYLGNPSLQILEQIGDAYIEEGKILRDPAIRKENFKMAAEFFNECHDIIEDKSYDNDMEEEDDSYIKILGRTHFNLAYFYRELLQYDDAISHYQTALEMAKTMKKKDYILKTLLRMGWMYMDIQSFGEAEKSFKESEKYQEASPLAKTEIIIGLMFSQVERVLFIDRNTSLDDIYKDWTEITENSIEEKAIEELELIDQLTLNQIQKKKRIEEAKNKKSRLLALYHECLGRFYWKQGKMDDVEKEFEISISFLPNPRVYLYLADFYLREASEYWFGRKETLIAKARNACKLCRKNDLRQQYENELANLEKKFETPGK